MKRMTDMIIGYEELSDKEKVALVLDVGCRDMMAGKGIECMWRRRFYSPE